MNISENMTEKSAISAHSKITQFLQSSNEKLPSMSKYWSEESESLEYMFTAGPEIIKRLRDHTHWLTGVRSYDYKEHHRHMSKKFARKLSDLRNVTKNLPVFGEMGVLGDFGHPINGQLFNIDTLKFVESCIAIEKSGVMDALRREKNLRVCEIGAGWGGFISHLSRHLPQSKFVIVDLPSTLIFSFTYLSAAFPNRSMGIFGADDYSGNEDFIFVLPDDFLTKFNCKIDLAVNMVSFQEMTNEQVSSYSARIRELEVKYLYSHNRTKSKHNPEIHDVKESIGDWKHFWQVNVLPVDYTFLEYQLNQMKGNLSWKLLCKFPRFERALNFLLSDKAKLKLFKVGSDLEKRNYYHHFFSNT